MSNLFKQNMTLPEMERLLEQYCKNDGTAINVTEKIPLSRDDMVLMRSYLDTFVNLKGDVSAFYDVNLAIIITWIFAEKYDGEDYSKRCYLNLSRLPQHHFKYYVELFSNTLIEFNINPFNEDYEELSGICNIMHQQAHYPDV